MKRRIYLDAAAAHPVRGAAVGAFVRNLLQFGNPSAPHEEGREASRVLEVARASIAHMTGAKPDAVLFTSGATESNALAILGHLKARLAEGASSLRVLYSPTQHASVMGVLQEAKRMGVTVEEVSLKDGALDLPTISERLSGATLITLDVVCGETGTRFDTRAVRHAIDALPVTERPVFHVDATQAPLVESIERTRIGADLISFDAQKIGGVRGIGALIAPRTIALAPLYEGGGQERGLRSGTPSPALAAAFSAALQEAAREREAFSVRARTLKQLLCKEITGAIPDAVVNGGTETAPHILNISLPGRDTDYLAALLDEAGIAVSTKSACETDADGSRVVLAYTGDASRASSTLRISLHRKTTERDLHAFMKAFRASVHFLDGLETT